MARSRSDETEVSGNPRIVKSPLIDRFHLPVGQPATALCRRAIPAAELLHNPPASLWTLSYMDKPASTPPAPPHAGRHFAAFLFDMDGTLIPGTGSANRAWTSWSQMRGFDPAHVISIMHGVRT